MEMDAQSEWSDGSEWHPPKVATDDNPIATEPLRERYDVARRAFQTLADIRSPRQRRLFRGLRRGLRAIAFIGLVFAALTHNAAQNERLARLEDVVVTLHQKIRLNQRSTFEYVDTKVESLAAGIWHHMEKHGEHHAAYAKDDRGKVDELSEDIDVLYGLVYQIEEEMTMKQAPEAGPKLIVFGPENQPSSALAAQQAQNKKLGKLKKALEQVKNEVSDIRGVIWNLDERVYGQRKDLATTQASVSGYRYDLDSAASQLWYIDGVLDDLKANYTTNAQHYKATSELHSRIDDNYQDIGMRLESVIWLHDDELERQAQNNTSLQTQIDVLSWEARDDKTQLADMERSIYALWDKTDQNLAESLAHENELAGIHDEIATLRDQVAFTFIPPELIPERHVKAPEQTQFEGATCPWDQVCAWNELVFRPDFDAASAEGICAWSGRHGARRPLRWHAPFVWPGPELQPTFSPAQRLWNGVPKEAEQPTCAWNEMPLPIIEGPCVVEPECEWMDLLTSPARLEQNIMKKTTFWIHDLAPMSSLENTTRLNSTVSRLEATTSPTQVKTCPNITDLVSQAKDYLSMPFDMLSDFASRDKEPQTDECDLKKSWLATLDPWAQSHNHNKTDYQAAEPMTHFELPHLMEPGLCFTPDGVLESDLAACGCGEDEFYLYQNTTYPLDSKICRQGKWSFGHVVSGLNLFN